MEPSVETGSHQVGWIPDRLRNQFGRLLSLTTAHSQRLVNRELSALGSRKYHFAVLAALDEHGPASQTALSGWTGIYTSDLVAAVNELSERGFVQRRTDPADKRRNLISITSAGLKHLEAMDETLTALQERILAPLDEDERERLNELLWKVHDHLAKGDV
ncbi:hypothetical protein GCM10027447_19030 [Glycomyces halotolerans]